MAVKERIELSIDEDLKGYGVHIFLNLFLFGVCSLLNLRLRHMWRYNARRYSSMAIGNRQHMDIFCLLEA